MLSVVSAQELTNNEEVEQPFDAIRIGRGVDTVVSSSVAAGACNFTGEIVLSHPQSISVDDRFYVTGSLSLEAVNLVIDRVNSHRCGIKLQDGNNYSVRLETYGDNSDKRQHVAIGNHMANNNSSSSDTDFWIGGYSSGLTSLLSPIAQANQKLLVAGGSTQTRVFEGRDYAYGILPPSSTYLEGAFAVVDQQGAKTVASLTEDGVGSCVSVPALSELYKMDLMESIVIPRDPSVEDFVEVAQNMSALNPEVMVTCVYDVGCAKWISAMRRVGWSPKAQIFTVCIGTTELETSAGAEDIAYMMGATSWVKNLPPIPDGITGWTPEEFADHFERYTYRNVTYQTAGAATSVSVLLQAIERLGELDIDAVRDEVANGTFPTMYGATSFDENGQNEAPSLVLQYNPNGNLHVLYPPSSVSSGSEIVYPMPTWDNRDCEHRSTCGATGGTCNEDGTCLCEQLGGYVSLGKAVNATCKYVPHEKKSYISDILIILGLCMFGGQCIMSAAFILWTFWQREHPVVKASQPFFLTLIASGAIIMSSAIVPLSQQNGEYRFLLDEITKQETDVLNPDTPGLDRVCMAFPWLFSLGFVLIFSALFAKILRVRKLLGSAHNFRRVQVRVQDVLFIMVIALLFQASILTAWQIVDPLRWEREVLTIDQDGYPLHSVGVCRSDKSLAFVIPLFLVDFLALAYSVRLGYVTREIPGEFSESKWITISIAGIVQILMLSVPIVIIASEERSALYFVQAGVTFSIGATVTVPIFVPKIWKVRHWDDDMDEPMAHSSGHIKKSGSSTHISGFKPADSKGQRENLPITPSFRLKPRSDETAMASE